jgi:hypothetical protein
VAKGPSDHSPKAASECPGGRALAQRALRWRMPHELDPAFVRDCPYAEDGLILDAILEVDRVASRLVARMPCHTELPLTRSQRSHPLRHPAHVAGGLMVHVTGILGFAHAYYVLDLRHAEGWVGFGARIHGARFHKLATLDAPLVLSCTASQVRVGPRRVFARYGFRFTQDGALVYEGDQSAMFVRIDESDPPPAQSS